MAKKPLRSPTSMPPGARRDFFTLVQDHVAAAGAPSTATLAGQIGFSHEAVYKALTGPRVPSWRITEAISVAVEAPACAAGRAGHPRRLQRLMANTMKPQASPSSSRSFPDHSGALLARTPPTFGGDTAEK